MESRHPSPSTGHGGDSDRPSTVPRRPSLGIQLQAVDPASVLSPEEVELLQRKFARFNPNSNKTRALSASRAKKLFRDDFPSLSEWEVQELFEKCDLNHDGHLALQEYLQTRAYYRLQTEAESELDIVRSFTILDTDSDGILVADVVLALVEQAKQPGARLLKQVIVQAAKATGATRGNHRRGRDDAPSSGQIPQPKGEITLEHFVHSIRDINRSIEREVATKTLRLLSVEDKLESLQQAQRNPTISSLHRATLQSKIQSTRLESDVLKTEVARCKKEVVSDTGSNSTLGKICETLVATYENEQHVYECLSNLITYCGLKDPVVFRYNLEQSGREVHVLDSILMDAPATVKHSMEYQEMMALAIHRTSFDQVDLHTHANCHSEANKLRPASLSNHANQRYERLKLNSKLRQQFVYYTMLGDATNLESMTRSAFHKFVKDCDLHLLSEPPLADPDINSIFSRATTQHGSLTARPQNTAETPRATGGMAFTDWLVACDLIFQHSRRVSSSENEELDADQLEELVRSHVVPKARCIQTQNIAPDISQSHVLKLLREHLWQLRQIFFHFGAKSLLEVDSKVTLDMRRFLCFARAFKILRASTERDGEPYSPPPLTESAIIQPISLVELIREFYAAKLDISFANSLRRDELDLNFREFTRCIQRIALAMHAHAPPAGTKNRYVPPNGILTTSFEAVKEDDERKPNHPEPPLYNRRGNILGAAVSPNKTCKMTSTSIISKLLHTSRALVAGNVSPDDDQNTSTLSPTRKPPQYLRSPTRIFYGTSDAASSIPFISPTVSDHGQENSVNSPSRPTSREQTTPWVPPYRPVSVPPMSPRAPPSPRSPRGQRPITCGGPAVVRVIKPPPDS